jgi:hypothetical protein
VVDINDFDEAAPGPWHWDLRRLAVGLVVAGGGEASARAAVAAYRAALAHAAEAAQAAPCTADLPVAGVAAAWQALELNQADASTDDARARRVIKAVGRLDARDRNAKTARAPRPTSRTRSTRWRPGQRARAPRRTASVAHHPRMCSAGRAGWARAAGATCFWPWTRPRADGFCCRSRRRGIR